MIYITQFYLLLSSCLLPNQPGKLANSLPHTGSPAPETCNLLARTLRNLRSEFSGKYSKGNNVKIGFLGVNGEGNGTPLQYSCLENPMDGGACWLQSMRLLSRTQLSDFTLTFHFHALEKEMETHSSVLICRIPGTGEQQQQPTKLGPRRSAG